MRLFGIWQSKCLHFITLIIMWLEDCALCKGPCSWKLHTALVVPLYKLVHLHNPLQELAGYFNSPLPSVLGLHWPLKQKLPSEQLLGCQSQQNHNLKEKTAFCEQDSNQLINKHFTANSHATSTVFNTIFLLMKRDNLNSSSSYVVPPSKKKQSRKVLEPWTGGDLPKWNK